MARVFCTECGAPSLASDKYCTGCGADLGQQLTQAGPHNGDTVAMSIEVRESRDSRWPLLVGIAATVVAVGALGYFLLLRPGATPSVASNTAPPRVEIPSVSPRPSESESPPADEASSTPRPVTTVTRIEPPPQETATAGEIVSVATADQAMALGTKAARKELARRRNDDVSRLDAMYYSWVPQLSSKCEGLRVDIKPDWVPDGRRETPSVSAQQILAFHLTLAERFDGVLVEDSDIGRGGSYRCDSPIWLALAGRTFNTADAANRWCDREGFPSGECFARRVVPAGEPGGRSKPRG